MAKEVTIRKRIANIFNKREDDFSSLREYNDYLEEVEDMTFKLIEGIDVPEVEVKIAKYQEENAEQIINSRARKAEELAAALKASKAHPLQADINDIGAGQSSQFAGIGLSVQGQYAPAAVTGTAAQPRPLGGPTNPQHGYASDDEDAMRLRARAGGWTVELSKKRAIEEAFSSIWL